MLAWRGFLAERSQLACVLIVGVLIKRCLLYDDLLTETATRIELFYSSGTGDNDELSSTREGYEFVGAALGTRQRRKLEFLDGKIELSRGSFTRRYTKFE